MLPSEVVVSACRGNWGLNEVLYKCLFLFLEALGRPSLDSFIPALGETPCPEPSASYHCWFQDPQTAL